MLSEETRHVPEESAKEALGRGDHAEALTLLMDAYGDAIYRFCRQMVSDAELAEDVHQLTFVQAYEALDRFGGRSSLRSWLYGIARHRCLDALKSQRRRLRLVRPVADLPETLDKSTDPETHALERGLQDGVERCLESLDPRQRMAVLLRFQNGLTYPEMAEACGERPATLQARVTRALPTLRHCLEGRGIEA
jgi:RNA polymerase sigma-70 factor (ECF subfamily)